MYFLFFLRFPSIMLRRKLLHRIRCLNNFPLRFSIVFTKVLLSLILFSIPNWLSFLFSWFPPFFFSNTSLILLIIPCSEWFPTWYVIYEYIYLQYLLNLCTEQIRSYYNDNIGRTPVCTWALDENVPVAIPG